MQRPRVRLLFAGGTALTARQSTGSRVRSARDVPQWMKNAQELNIVADIEAGFLSSGQGGHLQPALWELMANQIAKEYNRYDGFVITHDIETLHYTAPALACLMANTGKPIVLTASPYDLLKRGTPEPIRALFNAQRGFGIKDNLLNALQIAVADVAEVCVIFGNQIHRALELNRSHEPTLTYFTSLSGKLLGRVDFGLKLFPPIARRQTGPVKFQTKLETSLTTVDIHPGIPLEQLLKALERPGRAVLVKVEELTTLPAPLNQALLQQARQGRPVVIYRAHGLTERGGAFPTLVNLPYHTAYVLCLWALGQTRNPAQLKKLLDKQAGRIFRPGGGA